MPTLTLLDDAMLRAVRMVPAVSRLGGGSIAMAGSQQPWRVVGAESVVYQLRQTNGRVLALRCLLSDTQEPSFADRYRALGSEGTRRNLRAGGASPIIGQITYIPDGIALPGHDLRSETHALIAMEWVMGATLIAATDRASRARDRQYLLALAHAWLAAMETLDQIQFVHGNLTGDNALVRPREGIALVDYDTAYWPGAPLVKYLESRPGYRHPKGVLADPERRDDFAALVVYTSLRILAVWPELRDEHGDPASQLGGTLLFSARDLANPDGSALFGKIRVIDDPEVQTLIASLRDTCRRRPEDCPPFLETVRGVVTTVRQLHTTPLRPITLHDSERERKQKMSRLHGFLLAGEEDGAYHFWRTSGLIDDPEANREMGARITEIEHRRAVRTARSAAEQSDYAELLKQWERSGLENQQIAAPIRPIVEQARRRSVDIEALAHALRDGDAGAVGTIWPRVRRDPDASAFAAQANQVIAKLHGAAVAGAIERGDDAGIVEAVNDAEREGFAIGLEQRRIAREAQRRLDGRRRLDAALATDDRLMLATMALAGDLDTMGEFDPQTTRTIMRALATSHLLRAVSTDDDLAIYNAYEAEVFGGIGGVPADVANRVTLAVNRVRWLKTVRSAMKQRDIPTIKTAMAAMPEDADARFSKAERARIGRMLRQDGAIESLHKALERNDDTEIIDALNEIETCGAMLPPDLNWEAIRGVIERLSLVATIRRTVTAETVNYSRLARLLAQARDEMGGAVPYLGNRLDFVELEQDVWRAAHRSRVREALKGGDDKTIVSAALPDLYGAIETLDASERERVQRAIATHRGTGQLPRATV